MRHDEPHEWGLSALELREFLETGRFAGQDDRILTAARAAGWDFASPSVLSFTRCPCCKTATPLRDALERRAKVSTLSDLLDGDEDALTSMLAD